MICQDACKKSNALYYNINILMTTDSPISDFLNEKFQEWRIETINKGDKRVSLTAFAEYLTVKQPQLSAWINGEYAPSIENIKTLAEKLGPEIYAALGIDDPLITGLKNIYHQLTPQQQHRILEQAQTYATQNQQPDGQDPATATP